MSELYNNIMCISAAELTQGDNTIMSENAYKLYVYRNPHVRVRKGGGLGNSALLNWELLRSDLKRKYIEIKGYDPGKQKSFLLKDKVVVDYSAVEFYSNFILPDGRHLTTEKQEELCNNASILNALLSLSNERSALQKALNGKRNTWHSLATELRELKDEMPHSLPLNPARLKEKVKNYNGDYASLISAKFMNKNATSVREVEQEATLRQLFRKHNNLDNEQIRTLYNIIAEKLEWKEVTAATIENYRKKWNLTTYSGRHGETTFNNNLAMQVRRQSPSYPLYYWTVDGWEVELLYQKTKINKDGNNVTTYHDRMTAVVVLDPCCKYPIGFAIEEEESSDLTKQAIRNAILHTKELFGDYYKVLQVQSDNYGKKTLTPVYNVISEKYTPARVGNAKSKVIEPYFKELNHDCCQLLPNWAGYGVKSKRQPNDQYLNKIRHSFPDQIGVIKQIESIIAKKRSETITKYMQLFEEMPAEDRRTISTEELLYHFGETTGFVNTLTGPGVSATIEGRQYLYDSFDINFRRNKHESWCLHYLPEDTSQVLAVNAKGVNGKFVEEIGTLRFILNDKHVQPMALKERKDFDSENLKLIRDFNKSLKEEVLVEMESDYTEVRQLFQRPELEGTLTKLMLVDSIGQHKDNKSRRQLKTYTDKIIAKQNKAELDLQNKSWAKQQEEYLKSKVNLDKYLIINNN